MGKVLTMTYASSLTDLCEINSSFDTGVLRICYTGVNRNGSSISKPALKRCIPTLYNCPIVCNYDRESDELGGHDMEVVRSDDGSMHIVNSTQPVGVIPESARVWFDTFEDDNGVIHEYLYADVLLWKRQEAYKKIKDDGIVAHSMEITVKDSKSKDGVLNINDFEFTAFCLIGVEPCYESSSLETFARDDFKQQMCEMMQDLKETFSAVNTSEEVDDKHPQNSTEGGERVLDKKMELVEKYNIDIDSLDFSIEDFSEEELEEKFVAMQDPEDPDTEPEPEVSEEEESSEDEQFALTESTLEEMRLQLSSEKLSDEWGEYPRYYYEDSDFDLSEVYAIDCQDWNLYGFSYERNGDHIAIDFDSKKRMKYVVEEFDEGDYASPFADVYTMMSEKLCASLAFEKEASKTITSMEKELAELRKFKADTETATAQKEREELFARFSDLDGVDAFEELREESDEIDIDTLEEKCYAIRGRVGVTQTFSLEKDVPKMKVDRTQDTEEPYGGLFKEYGIDGSN